MELAGLIRDVRAAGIACEALERAAEALVAAARSAIERGTNPATVAEALSVFPSGTKARRRRAWASSSPAGPKDARGPWRRAAT